MHAVCLSLRSRDVRHHRGYLFGHHFRVFTDQKSFKNLISQTIQTPAQQKWLTKLLGFDFEIIYTPGKENVVADALSPHSAPSEAIFSAISWCQPLILVQLQQFYLNHPVGQALMAKFQTANTDNTIFSIQQGILYFKNRIFVPLETDLRHSLLSEFHCSPLGWPLRH